MAAVDLNLSLVAHADWSLRADKRFVAIAERGAGGRWAVGAPRRADAVAPDATLCRALSERTPGFVLFGLDLPLGVPRAWADLAGVTDFCGFLTNQAGTAPWADFWDPATDPSEVALTRPFYPRRPGGTSRAQLVSGLGLSGPDDLRRRCDMPRPGAPTPCPIFWTLGANQVGKAAITAWRDMIQPALNDPNLDARLFPFEGSLYEATRGDIGLAEVYPAEVYAWLGLDLSGGGKRAQRARAANADLLLSALDALGADPSPDAAAQVADGFGDNADGEDRFDAFVGMIGALQVGLGVRADGVPWADRPVREVEGWVLGREAA
jgi:hypothetical protein